MFERYGRKVQHLLKPGESYPDDITEAQATAMLLVDVQAAEGDVTLLVKVPLTQGMFDALTDFCFNLGAGRLASSTVLKMLNQGKYSGAGQQLLLWCHVAGVKPAGLLRRRQGELALWQGTTTSVNSGQ